MFTWRLLNPKADSRRSTVPTWDLTLVLALVLLEMQEVPAVSLTETIASLSLGQQSTGLSGAPSGGRHS
jgi:hypothetical protein